MMSWVSIWLFFTFFGCAISFGLDDATLSALDATRDALSGETPSVTIVTPSIAPTYSRRRYSPGRRRSHISRRRSSRRRRTTMKKVKKRAPYNKYMEAINQVERSFLAAGAMRPRRTSTRRDVLKLESMVTKACQSREYIFARQMLGHAMYAATIGSRRRTRGKRSTASATRGVVNDIKRILGQTKYSKLMALDGGVTLAFAVDTTGSMGDEIQAVKKIAKALINQKRNMEVDYILSPFNDPKGARGHGPVNYKSSSEKKEFVKLISKLPVTGGGDCPELAITGIQNIYSQSPEYDSPIYVFTDAGAKDASKKNLDLLYETADKYLGYSTPINFFLSKSGWSCLKNKDVKLFRKIAEKTGGEVLLFNGASQLSSMSKYIKKSLTGGVTIPIETSGKTGKRSSSARYPILVDDSIQTLTISVVKGNTYSTVTLSKPSGILHTSGRTNIKNGVLYYIDNPRAGLWYLTVSRSDWRDHVIVKGISELNIDFDFNFIVKFKVGRRRTKTIVSRNPLKGQLSNVMVTVYGHKKIIPSSLRLLVVDEKSLTTLKNVPLIRTRNKGSRYKCSFAPPPTDFKLIFTGKTRHGNTFKRIARGNFGMRATLLRIHYAPRGFILKPGDSSGTTIYFALHNLGRSERFSIEVIDKQNYVQPLVAGRVFVRKGRMALIPVRYKAPISARKGSMHKSVLVAIGLRSKIKIRTLLDLLVV